MTEEIEKIKKVVHQPLNWEDYNSTIVIQNTNCFSHAIGSTLESGRPAYRIGILSENKKAGEMYFSMQEVKKIFLDDLAVLQLKAEEIPFDNLKSFIEEQLPKINLADNEHIVALFVKIYGREENIRDFHFLRYDKEKGWSDKRWMSKVNFMENILISWPSNWNDKLVGIFKITK